MQSPKAIPLKFTGRPFWFVRKMIWREGFYTLVG